MSFNLSSNFKYYTMELPAHILSRYTTPIYPVEGISTEPGTYYLPEHRIDLTHLQVYTIDPAGSTDADDAFSVEHTDVSDEWNLYIHIADPTSFFEPHDPLFQSIKTTGVSQYPTLHRSRHMFPRTIIETCTLIDGIKPAITLKYQMNENDISSCECMLSTIQCDASNRFTYEEAGAMIQHPTEPFHKVLSNLCFTTEFLRAKRVKDSETTYMHTYTSRVCIDASGNIQYKSYTDETIRAKQMIEELAIQSNKTVASLLYEKAPGSFISRECSINGETIHTENLILDIISNGYKTSYSTKLNQHMILNLNMYTHFTSPLRRFSDCLTHFCVKHSLIQNKTTSLFTPDEMTEYSQICTRASKLHRSASFADNKYRMFQYIHQQLQQGRDSIPITFVRSGVVCSIYVNAMVNNIDGYPINVSYMKRLTYSDDFQEREKNKGTMVRADIHTCNMPSTRYDMGVLPDIEMLL
jgi:ribonuclease R